MFIQPYELGILCVVADGLIVCFFEVGADDPADVRIPETIDQHRVRIFRSVAMTVVMTMVCCPPENSFLGRCHCAECDHELEPTGGLIRLMSKVTMIAAG